MRFSDKEAFKLYGIGSSHLRIVKRPKPQIACHTCTPLRTNSLRNPHEPYNCYIIPCARQSCVCGLKDLSLGFQQAFDVDVVPALFPAGTHCAAGATGNRVLRSSVDETSCWNEWQQQKQMRLNAACRAAAAGMSFLPLLAPAVGVPHRAVAREVHISANPSRRSARATRKTLHYIDTAFTSLGLPSIRTPRAFDVGNKSLASCSTNLQSFLDCIDAARLSFFEREVEAGHR